MFECKVKQEQSRKQTNMWQHLVYIQTQHADLNDTLQLLMQDVRRETCNNDQAA